MQTVWFVVFVFNLLEIHIYTFFCYQFLTSCFRQVRLKNSYTLN